MSGGLILLTIMVLFIAAMYLYAYGTTDYLDYKAEKTKKRKLRKAEKKEQLIKLEMLERQKEREEQYRIANARSKEIQKELKRLAGLKK